MNEVLELINDKLTAAGINYDFGQWNSEPVYPYFVGSIVEPESMTEDGRHEYDVTLTGFSRASVIDLITACGTIESLFSNYTEILPSGSGITVDYAGSMTVPTGDAELKRLDINLSINEWRVN